MKSLDNILESCNHLIGRTFCNESTGKYYKFIGILTDNDDHYYAMYSKENGLYLSSCVCDIMYSFDLVEN